MLEADFSSLEDRLICRNSPDHIRDSATRHPKEMPGLRSTK